MQDIWNRVEALKGKTLSTLARGKRFTIADVHHDRVQFVPEDSTGTVRWFPREGIEHFAKLDLKPGELTASHVAQERPSTRNGSYVAAIVYEVTRNNGA